MMHLTYAEALTRQAQVCGHLGALWSALPVYAQTVAQRPERFQGAPTPEDVTQALTVITQALHSLCTDDYREVTPS